MNTNHTKEIITDKNGKEHEIVDFNNDYTGAKLGFWLFLFTEIMLFGSMFLILAFYFYRFPNEFVHSSKDLNVLAGAINTMILLISTYYMGTSVSALKNRDLEKTKQNLKTTIYLAILFLVIKYFEWKTEFHHGIFPNSDLLNSMDNGKIIFFGLYFTMTGFHGLHILAGIALIYWVMTKIKKGEITHQKTVILENSALYWDLVHLVWVFLFPLFYMIGYGG